MPNTDNSAATIEDVKSYWDARPCNIRHSKAEIGTVEYFEQVERRKYFVEPHIPVFADFPAWKGKKVLEIGCGIGTDAVNFARAGAEYHAIELSETSLDLARRRFDLFGLKGEFHQGNAERLSEIVPVQEFDLIYSFGVIHHTSDPRKVVEEARRFMGAASEFRLMLYAKNSWKNIMIEAGFDQPEAQSGCPIAYTYTHDEIRALLSGYEVLDIRQAHIFPYVVEKYVKHEYQRQPWFEAMPAELFKALEDALGWHTLVRARPNRAG